MLQWPDTPFTVTKQLHSCSATAALSEEKKLAKPKEMATDNGIIIGCDHGAFALKQEMIAFMKSKGLKVTDVGCFNNDRVSAFAKIVGVWDSKLT